MNANRDLMMYDARKKSILLAALLLFLFGGFGAHRFYVGSRVIGCIQLFITLVGLFLGPLGLGFFILVFMAFWVLIDAFLLPGLVRAHNVSLANTLS